MFPFSPSVIPAVRTHLDAQAAFLNDMSKSLSRSFQELCQLNMQLGQTMLEESTIVGHQMLTAHRPEEVIAVPAGRAQPAAEKLRAYQQHMSRVAADAQVELARVTEQHVQETSRTARALADEVARTAADETDRSLRNQEASLRNFRDPFDTKRGNGAAHQGNMQAANGGMNGNTHLHTEGEHVPFNGTVGSSQAAQAGQGGVKAGKSA